MAVPTYEKLFFGKSPDMDLRMKRDVGTMLRPERDVGI
jgi:hypothetical protein